MCDDYLCGAGAQCIVTSSGPTCKCPEGFNGNPFPGGECATDICSPANPCAHPSICIGGRCKERCEGVVCGVGAHCDKNTNKCICDPFFLGNPDLICVPRKYFFKLIYWFTIYPIVELSNYRKFPSDYFFMIGQTKSFSSISVFRFF